MREMFAHALAFNHDLSKWDVSSVTDMQSMFESSAFRYELCGDAWINSEADKADMFVGCVGGISEVVCPTTNAGMIVCILCLCPHRYRAF